MTWNLELKTSNYINVIKRFVLIVIDSLGVGALPDADRFNDRGADTLGHILRSNPNLSLPNLEKLGLLNISSSSSNKNVIGSYGRMACASPAKDSIAGHWELAGLVLDKPLPVYPGGFPRSLIEEFEKKIGTKTIGNLAGSGTAIIEQLGEEHFKTNYPIVYTSADSVFQIAAHEKKFGLEKLYDICRIARAMLTGEHGVGRVIARPFIGEPGNFKRTPNRKDFSLDPLKPTLLNRIKDAGGEVIAIGKVTELFNGQGITKQIHTDDNVQGMAVTLGEVLKKACAYPSLIFTNLVDFDMLWGHRRNDKEYANGLKAFDDFLPELLNAIDDDDALILTADHGCDPTYLKHTDHTREYVPILIFGKQIKKGINLGTRKSFADLAETVADVFNLDKLENGTSMKIEILASAIVPDRRF